jgi:hypothetical protein
MQWKLVIESHQEYFFRRHPNVTYGGLFECPYCNFTYSAERGVDLVDKRLSIVRVRKRGALWDNKLRELWNEGRSVWAISKILCCGEQKIRLRLGLLGLIQPKQNGQKWKAGVIKAIARNQAFIEKREISRKRWLEMQIQFPRENARDLIIRDERLWGWLYKKDRNWLRDHSPELARRGSQLRGCQKRLFNWNERDEHYVRLIAQAVEELKNRQGAPVRITKGAMCAQASIRFPRSDKLPLTICSIAKHAESYAEWRLRWDKWNSDCARNLSAGPLEQDG